jgi:hypothetical protein
MEDLEGMSNKICQFSVEMYLIHKDQWRYTDGTITDAKTV